MNGSENPIESSPFTSISDYGLNETAYNFTTDDFLLRTNDENGQKEGEFYADLYTAYTASEGVVAFLAIVGNALVVYVFSTNRSLRRYRNYYIVALAVADFLVGLIGIPLAVLSIVGLPRNLYGCLFTLSILMVLCTISILCLVAVSVDRYWATTNPFAYYRNMTTSTSVAIILICWVLGAIIGFLPLFGWHNPTGWADAGHLCKFTKIMDYSYLVFLYFATIISPALIMLCFYGYIYHVVLIKIRQKGTLAPRRTSDGSRSGSLNSDCRGPSQIHRIMVSEKRREAKAAKKLGIIVLFFMICWIPLYTINCVQFFCRDCEIPLELTNFTIILSHANSALNPFLYAYHLKEFRLAMKKCLCTCLSRLLCGLIPSPAVGESSSAVSRSQTIPSLTNPALASQQNKLSGKLCRETAGDGRRSPTPRYKMGPTGSRDSLLPSIPTGKSSFSLSSDTTIVEQTEEDGPPETHPELALRTPVGNGQSLEVILETHNEPDDVFQNQDVDCHV